MNNLSLLIYLADVVNSASNTSEIVSFMSGLALLFLIPFSICYISDKYAEEEAKVLVKKLVKYVCILFVVSVLITIIAPNKDTMYLIAASEAGEAVLTNPEVIEIMDVIKDYLLEQIKL